MRKPIKYTKHGVRDLGGNNKLADRRPTCAKAGVCFPGPFQVVDYEHRVDRDTGETYEYPLHGRLCQHCRKILGPAV